MVKIINFEGRSIELKYFQTAKSGRGTIYSTEVRFGLGDKIIIDGITPWKLENKLSQLLPASIHSRKLVEMMEKRDNNYRSPPVIFLPDFPQILSR